MVITTPPVVTPTAPRETKPVVSVSLGYTVSTPAINTNKRDLRDGIFNRIK